jgi:hypothetical protein
MAQGTGIERDKQLLSALQTFQDALLVRLRDSEAALDRLTERVSEEEIGVADVINRFQLLSHTQFMEQVAISALYCAYKVLESLKVYL